MVAATHSLKTPDPFDGRKGVVQGGRRSIVVNSECGKDPLLPAAASATGTSAAAAADRASSKDLSEVPSPRLRDESEL